jgi:hypothetical protein
MKTSFSNGSYVTPTFLNTMFVTNGGHVHDDGTSDGHSSKIILTSGVHCSGNLPSDRVDNNNPFITGDTVTEALGTLIATEGDLYNRVDILDAAVLGKGSFSIYLNGDAFADGLDRPGTAYWYIFSDVYLLRIPTLSGITKTADVGLDLNFANAPSRLKTGVRLTKHSINISDGGIAGEHMAPGFMEVGNDYLGNIWRYAASADAYTGFTGDAGQLKGIIGQYIFFPAA